jgi:hypothetical protein
MAASVVHFQPESLSAFQRQLAAGEIHAVTFNKIPHSMHLSLNDHQHLLVVYPPQQYKAVFAQVTAKGVSVKFVKHAKAAAKPAHHKLRYIAGGILVLFIVVVLIVLLVGRRRTLLEELSAETPSPEPEGSSGSTPANPG